MRSFQYSFKRLTKPELAWRISTIHYHILKTNQSHYSVSFWTANIVYTQKNSECKKLGGYACSTLLFCGVGVDVKHFSWKNTAAMVTVGPRGSVMKCIFRSEGWSESIVAYVLGKWKPFPIMLYSGRAICMENSFELEPREVPMEITPHGIQIVSHYMWLGKS